MDRRAWMTIVGLGVLLLAAGAWRMGVGGWPAAGDGVVLELRAVRVGVAMVVGAGLAVAGVLLQALFRNPLAAPDLLGLSSGASLAVMVSVYAGGFGGAAAGGAMVGGSVWQGLPAVVGAVGALGLVYALSQRRGLVEPVSLVLTGVVVGMLCAAGVMLVQHLMPDAGFNTARLLVGTISDETAWGTLAVVGGVTLACVALAAALGPMLDGASLGEDEAASVGVPVPRLRLALFLIAGVLAAGAVVLAGPIGFVGLVVPHGVRMLMGPRHRGLVVGSALGGAGLLVLADAAIKAVDLGAGRMPMGVVTALVGGPVLVVLLRRGVRAG
jgi:iron complex transport system permease protein